MVVDVARMRRRTSGLTMSAGCDPGDDWYMYTLLVLEDGVLEPGQTVTVRATAWNTSDTLDNRIDMDLFVNADKIETVTFEAETSGVATVDVPVTVPDSDQMDIDMGCLSVTRDVESTGGGGDGGDDGSGGGGGGSGDGMATVTILLALAAVGGGALVLSDR